MKKQELINFTKKVIEEYKKGKTYGPVHLSGGNEEQLIEIFKYIKRNDWVFTTHRSHFHALLKSKNKKWLMKEIIEKAQSSHINSKKYKIFSSAIVGGIIPIALGTAMAIKLKEGKEKVYCFIGDFASQMGQFNEAVKYADGYKLPIVFIIENNKIGCETPLYSVWPLCSIHPSKRIIYYEYTRIYPHYGVGKWIIFKDKKVKGKGDYIAEELE